MKDSEVALLEDHVSPFDQTLEEQLPWITIEIFNRTTKKKVSTYGPFKDKDEATLFAKEHHINLTQ